MLRSEHALAAFDFQTGTLHPDRLRQRKDQDYLRAAQWMLRVYRAGVGETRESLHRRVTVILERLPDCPPRRINAFCKLLDDRGTFHHDRAAAVKLRQRVFAAGAAFHPVVASPEGLFEQDLVSVRQKLAAEIGRPWAEIEAMLFADVLELQTLQAFDAEFSAADLLALYNVSQTQVALYRAVEMRVEAASDFKTIVRHAKLAGLMHRVTRQGPAARPVYQFDFDGAASSLRQTWRYGIRFAQLLPKLLTCRQWQLTARVMLPTTGPLASTGESLASISGPSPARPSAPRLLTLRVSPKDGLRSPLPPPEPFDSKLEAMIDEAWNEAPVEGWTLSRETELLCEGQTVMTPDFALWRHSDPEPFHVEVVGYWTPEYLSEKIRRLEQFRGAADRPRRWILVIPQASAATHQVFAKTVCFPTLWIGRKFIPHQLTQLAEQVAP